MPWTYLEKLWKRTMESNTGRTTDASSWDKEIEVLYRLGISMEDTLQFLYFEKPDFGSFKSWIKANRKDSVISVEFEEVLSKQDLEFWDKNGYVILKEVISKEECKATENAIWEFLGMNPEKKDTWYERHAEQKGLMVNFSNHQTLNRNRLSERIYKAFYSIVNLIFGFILTSQLLSLYFILSFTIGQAVFIFQLFTDRFIPIPVVFITDNFAVIIDAVIYQMNVGITVVKVAY